MSGNHWNTDAERTILAAILNYGFTFPEGSRAPAGHILTRRHEIIFNACLALHTRAEKVDLISVCKQLQVDGLLEEAGGNAYACELLSVTCQGTFLESALQTVWECYTRRETRRKLAEAMDKLEDGGDIGGVHAVLEKLPTLTGGREPWERFFFHGKGYAMEDGGRYIPLAENQVGQHLRASGVHRDEIARMLCNIRTTNYVVYSGPLPGHSLGLHETEGGKILCTSAPRIIEAKPGPSQLVDRIMSGLLADSEHPEQLGAVRAWLRQARLNVKAGRRRPLPALAMVGPRGGGKTLLLEIFRLSLGGRYAPAYRAMLGEKNGFNADLLGGELLTVDDERLSSDHRARVGFGQAIKTHLFGGSVRIEGKHKDAFSCRPVWALAIALNDEPEHVRVLPELDESLADKISLARTRRAQFEPGEAEDREALMHRIESELPGFLHALEAEETPEHLRDVRTGAAAWQHPEVLSMIREIAPETRLAELITQCGTVQAGDWWKGTAAELESALMADETTKHGARSMLSWPGACGIYLGRLADTGRFGIYRQGQRRGVAQWLIRDEGEKDTVSDFIANEDEEKRREGDCLLINAQE